MKGNSWCDREALEFLYVDQALSSYSIADRFGVTAPAVRYWLRRWNIPVRTKSEAQIGDSNPGWVGGESRWKCNRNKAFLNRVRKVLGCSACGYRRSAMALEFHHRDAATKKFAVMTGINKKRATLKKEIRKCNVLCANCHNELHYLHWESKRRYRKSQTGRNRCLVDRIRKIKGCAECGYKKCIAALEFHHVDPKVKEFEVAATESFCRTRAEIVKEIRKCIIVCANCHREKLDDSST